LPRTTKGWEIQVVFCDESTTWLAMNEVQMSNLIELAEYAVMSQIAKEPVFAWWVPHALCTHQKMISKVKSKYWRTTHKFGIELPKNVKDAYEIDKKMGTAFWGQAIERDEEDT
jgi:hypothetical protein